MRRVLNVEGSTLTLNTQGEIFTCKFDPSGEHIASASFDRQICEFIMCAIFMINWMLIYLFFFHSFVEYVW